MCKWRPTRMPFDLAVQEHSPDFLFKFGDDPRKLRLRDSNVRGRTGEILKGHGPAEDLQIPGIGGILRHRFIMYNMNNKMSIMY